MEDLKNSEITKSNEDSLEINGIIQFLLVASLLFAFLGAVFNGYNILDNPIENLCIELVLCLHIFLVFRVLDRCRWALFAMYVELFVSLILAIIKNGFDASAYKILITIVFWVLIFFLPQKGKTSWSIILNAPQSNKIEKKDRLALMVIYTIIFLVTVVGLAAKILS